LLRVERPDYQYLKKVFQYTRSILAISPAKVQKRLPELLTDHELVGFYEAVWHARNPTHMIMIKLVLSRCTKLGGYGRKAAIFD
jgi:integrase/recombinase XerD